jgi:predicted amidophosphoribosyltransferase
VFDPLSFGDHCYLAADDSCYHLGEYTARRGYSFSDTNQLISNLKKKPTVRHESQWRHKENAIVKIAGVLCSALTHGENKQLLSRVTLVPIPPSAALGDPLYDDRMTRILNGMRQKLGMELDIRELVKQRSSTHPVHENEERPTPWQIVQNYYLDEDLVHPAPDGIWVFDDMLTTGAHYKAMQTVIRDRFPDIVIVGIFVARRVPETDEIV